MFDKRYSILSISILLIIVIMCVIIFSLKYSKKKESFSSTCNIDCNNNLWDNYFKTGNILTKNPKNLYSKKETQNSDNKKSTMNKQKLTKMFFW